MDPLDIRHAPDRGRFHADVEGHACVLDYALAEGRMVIRHTGVPQAVGGRGIAGALVGAALDWARDARLRVVPECSYAAGVEYADLVDPA